MSDITMQGQSTELPPSTTTSAAPAAPADPSPPAPTGTHGEILQIPVSAMSKIKGEERRKGQLALAKRYGFETVEEMEAAMRAKQTPQRPAPAAARARTAAPPAPAAEPTLSRKDAARLQELEDQNKRLTRDKNREMKQKQALQQQLATTTAESKLRQIALRCGVVEEHLDFALFQLKQKVRGLAAGQLAKFNEAEFFSQLRTRYSYIFSAVATAPSTGVSTGANASGQKPAQAPADAKPPTPGQATAAAANGQQVDALKLDDSSWQELLRKNNISL